MPEQQQGNEESPHESQTLPLHGLPARKSANFTMVYANSVQSIVSPWDFSLMFGQMITDDPNTVHIEQRVSLTLSLQTAKALADIVLRNLREYEQKYGEVRYTPLPQSSEDPSA